MAEFFRFVPKGDSEPNAFERGATFTWNPEGRPMAVRSGDLRDYGIENLSVVADLIDVLRGCKTEATADNHVKANKLSDEELIVILQLPNKELWREDPDFYRAILEEVFTRINFKKAGERPNAPEIVHESVLWPISADSKIEFTEEALRDFGINDPDLFLAVAQVMLNETNLKTSGETEDSLKEYSVEHINFLLDKYKNASLSAWKDNSVFFVGMLNEVARRILVMGQ